MILVEGNSLVFELFLYWLCESDEAQIWHLDFNDMYARVENDTYSSTLLILDNDKFHNISPYITIAVLEALGLVPDVIYLGYFNEGWPWQGTSPQYRRMVYSVEYPDAHLIDLPVHPLAGVDPCGTDDGKGLTNYCTSTGVHQCIPGPIARIVEELVGELIQITHEVHDRKVLAQRQTSA